MMFCYVPLNSSWFEVIFYFYKLQTSLWCRWRTIKKRANTEYSITYAKCGERTRFHFRHAQSILNETHFLFWNRNNKWNIQEQNRSIWRFLHSLRLMVLYLDCLLLLDLCSQWWNSSMTQNWWANILRITPGMTHLHFCVIARISIGRRRPVDVFIPYRKMKLQLK